MNAERYIRKLNALLRQELGENPLYAWIYSESPEFLRPMRVQNDDGTLPWNYRCPCGLNAMVHSVECLNGKLVIAEPIYEIRKTDIWLNDQWVLCCHQPPPSEHEWYRLFGSMLPYSAQGSWAPVSTETRTIAMKPGVLPGELLTMAAIRGRQKSREIPEREITNATVRRQAKHEADQREGFKYRLKSVLPVNPNPGTRGGSISWGGVAEGQPLLKGHPLITP